jgi:hypothetical protein
MVERRTDQSGYVCTPITGVSDVRETTDASEVVTDRPTIVTGDVVSPRIMLCVDIVHVLNGEIEVAFCYSVCG